MCQRIVRPILLMTIKPIQPMSLDLKESISCLDSRGLNGFCGLHLRIARGARLKLFEQFSHFFATLASPDTFLIDDPESCCFGKNVLV